MSEIEIKNAKIESTRLGYDRGVFLCAWIYLGYGGSVQGFGGYVLAIAKNEGPIRPLNDFGIESINRILGTLGVESWEQLPGTPCRVKCEYSKVHAIGHYLNDKWFSYEELKKELKIDYAPQGAGIINERTKDGNRNRNGNKSSSSNKPNSISLQQRRPTKGPG